ncbi:MAG: hypothetical protein ETSY1_41610 [Candidatus Entotheonella factor]|uniref:Alpha 1,4-glycosyltransferase domain-containing protein n=1 Tax=Entotheonella factor TaxID=1429438 RepID=W4L4V0_ENTF1|nr:MAG: hypothetical protein ETSY1_41610 [Candidatus Entotheonella factor]
MRDVMQGLWVGTELSVMEQLSISSFLHHGHPYHLYVYEEVKNIPHGTVVRDANDILPASMIFQYKDFPTYAGFANFFRYKLLLDRGGWWVDTDLVCLKPFEFTANMVFSTERYDNIDVINNGVIRVPVGSEIMAYVWHVCQQKKVEELAWGEAGPVLIGEAVQRFSLEQHVQPYQVFCPLGYEQRQELLLPNPTWQPDDTTYAIHLWNEMWRRGGVDKNARYDPSCIYEQLQARYLRS